MFSRQSIEYRVIHILDGVIEKRQTEDRTFELKTEWPKQEESYDTARQIAGHANAARGEPIIWIIGANQRNRVVCGAPSQEVKPWHDPHRKHFDGEIMPALLDSLVVPYKDTSVVAMVFDTTRAPYVIKVPHIQGSKCRYEVPFRSGENAYTSTREQLLRILVPASQQPSIEIIRIDVNDGHEHHGPVIKMTADIYIDIPGSGRATIPVHRCGLAISKPNKTSRVCAEWLNMKPHAFGDTAVVSPHAQVIVDGGIRLLFDGSVRAKASDFADSDLEMLVTVGTRADEHTTAVVCKLRKSQNQLWWSGPVTDDV